MSEFEFTAEKPGLLVSVRNAMEAQTALAGGADVIDIKEPARGALGAADSDTIGEIVKVVAGRAPVSAALGELVELLDPTNGNSLTRLVNGVSLFKVGLSGCANHLDWQIGWQRLIASIAAPSASRSARPVAVAYADWRAAESPPPHDVLNAAIDLHCPILLVDTWGKSGGTLFDHWPIEDVRRFCEEVTSHGIAIVLAGSLTGANIANAARLAPYLVAVRTAACEGGREGTVCEKRVRELKSAIAQSTKRTVVR